MSATGKRRLKYLWGTGEWLGGPAAFYVRAGVRGKGYLYLTRLSEIPMEGLLYRDTKGRRMRDLRDVK